MAEESPSQINTDRLKCKSDCKSTCDNLYPDSESTTKENFTQQQSCSGYRKNYGYPGIAGAKTPKECPISFPYGTCN
jgi:hypothetical protein